MFRRKQRYYLVLTPDEVALAPRAMLTFRNKVVARGIDSVDVDGLIKKLT